jgi:hypothetical protein
MFIASFSSRSNVRIHFHSNCAPLPTLLSAASRRLRSTPSSPLLVAPHHTPCSLPLTVSSCPLLLTLCPSLCMPHCPPCSLPSSQLLPLLLALCPSLFLGCLKVFMQKFHRRCLCIGMTTNQTNWRSCRYGVGWWKRRQLGRDSWSQHELNVWCMCMCRSVSSVWCIWSEVCICVSWASSIWCMWSGCMWSVIYMCVSWDDFMFNLDVIWYVMMCFLYVQCNWFVIWTPCLWFVCGLGSSAM